MSIPMINKSHGARKDSQRHASEKDALSFRIGPISGGRGSKRREIEVVGVTSDRWTAASARIGVGLVGNVVPLLPVPVLFPLGPTPTHVDGGETGATNRIKGIYNDKGCDAMCGS